MFILPKKALSLTKGGYLPKVSRLVCMWQSWDLKPQIFHHNAQMSTASKSHPSLLTRITDVPGAWGRGCWFCGQTPARMSSVWASEDSNHCWILLTIFSVSSPSSPAPDLSDPAQHRTEAVFTVERGREGRTGLSSTGHLETISRKAT